MQEQQKGARKAKKEAKAGPAAAPAAAAPSWDTAKHPWRPFDREKDLGQAPKAAKNPMLSAGRLSDRFG